MSNSFAMVGEFSIASDHQNGRIEDGLRQKDGPAGDEKDEKQNYVLSII